MRDSMTRIAMVSPAGSPRLLASRLKREMAASVSGLGCRVSVGGPMADGRVVRRLFKAVLFASGLLAVPMASLAAAQDRPGPSFEVTAGWVGFADDGIVSETLGGGAARWYLLPCAGSAMHLQGPPHLRTTTPEQRTTTTGCTRRIRRRAGRK